MQQVQEAPPRSSLHPVSVPDSPAFLHMETTRFDWDSLPLKASRAAPGAKPRRRQEPQRVIKAELRTARLALAAGDLTHRLL